MGNDAIDYINRDIVNVKTELQTLNKLVRDGNGQPSLIQQVATLQQDIKYIEVNLKDEICNLSDRIDAYQTTAENIAAQAAEKNNVSWQFKAAIIVALISSLTSIAINWQSNHDTVKAADIEQLTSEHMRSEKALSQKIDKLLGDKK